MLTVPEGLALLYAAPAHSEITARMRQVLDVGLQPSKVLAAASLIELVLAGRLTVESRRQRLLRADVVLVTNAASTGDASTACDSPAQEGEDREHAAVVVGGFG